MGEKDKGSILKRAAVTALGVFLGSNMISGISYDEPITLLWVVLTLSLISAFLRPLLVLFALPFVVLTLGVGLLFINALLYLLVGNLINGFEVASFGAAFWGALVISMLNLFLGAWIGGGPVVRTSAGGSSSRSRERRSERAPLKAKDDVIDI